MFGGIALLLVIAAMGATEIGAAADPLRFQVSHVDLDLDITPQEGDWIIGDDPLDETLVLTSKNAGDIHEKDIFIINKGKLRLEDVQGAGINIHGNIYMKDNAAFEVVNSRLNFKDPAGVAFKVLAARDNASVLIDEGSVVDQGALAFYFMYGACKFSVLNGSETKGATECVLGYDSIGVLDSVSGLYETYGGENTKWTFRNIQPNGGKDARVFYWIRFTDGVTGEVRDIPDISADQTHITTDIDVGTFTAKFEDVNVQAWAVHSNPGSNVRIDLSDLPEKGKKSKFVVGVQVKNPVKHALPRLEARAVNTVDLSEALGDRVLKINDTYLYTCQVWAKLNAPGEVIIGPDSIIGEGSCDPNTTYRGANVCFDGTGGMFDVNGGLTHFTDGSRFGRAEIPWGIGVRVHGDGRLILEDGSFQAEGTSLTVAHNGSVWLKNSYMEHWDRLKVLDEGRVRVAWIETPVEGAEVSGAVEIAGLIDSRNADGSALERWTLALATASDVEEQLIAEGAEGALEKHALVVWDTRKLPAGDYRLTLTGNDSEGAFSIVRNVRVAAVGN